MVAPGWQRSQRDFGPARTLAPLATAGSLQDLLVEVEARGPDLVEFDLRRLSFMDCSGARVLLEGAARARLADQQLKVICAAGQVSRLLSVSNADRQLDIAERRVQRRTQAEGR